jgi:fumarate reductase flavoprotein subunit
VAQAHAGDLAGWRGYGAKDHVDHPDTPRRAAQIEAIEAGLTGADPAARQAALMPFLDLLPPGLRGRNERLAEPLS